VTIGSAPVTRASLAAELAAGGVLPGATVLVHSSLRALGFVSGGAVAVVLALLDALGERGTLVMPAHSSGLSEPSRWRNPPVPESWWESIRATMPAFDPRVTPTRRMGAIAEAFRSFPGVLRSAHPSGSFAAAGPLASRIVDGHALDIAFGETSPLARLHETDAHVLLLGVGHDSNTSLHLAEVRWGGLPAIEEGAPVAVGGVRVWKTFRELDYDAADFPTIGAEFAATGGVRGFRTGACTSLLMSQRALVDFAVGWMRANRSAGARRAAN
jgi:aminoglycoside 3-N-acetyltransferase